MPTTNYYSVNGRLIGEKVGAGGRIDYLTDALGNVMATANQGGNVVNTYRYKPYGGLLAKTGVGADPANRWVGAHGYRQTGKKYSDVYIRVRHHDTLSGRWSTSDLYWPVEPAYIYALENPSSYPDPSGHTPAQGPTPYPGPSGPVGPFPARVDNCDRDPTARPAFSNMCKCVGALSANDWRKVNQCIKDATQGATPPCPLMDTSKQGCMKTWCNAPYPCGEFHCVWKDECRSCFGIYVSPYCFLCYQGSGHCAVSYPIFGCGIITMCMDHTGTCGCVGGGTWPYCVIGHELGHMCGIHHNKGHKPEDLCNEAVGTCLEEACRGAKRI